MACASCKQAAALRVIDPLAAHASCCGSSRAMNGLLPTIVWPSDVDALKRQLNPDMTSTDAAVAACTTLDASTRSAWADFYAAWKSFYAESTPLFGSANKYDEAQSYQERLAAWQSILRASCTLPGPMVVPPSKGDESAASVIKWAAAAAIVVAVVYGVRTVIR